MTSSSAAGTGPDTAEAMALCVSNSDVAMALMRISDRAILYETPRFTDWLPDGPQRAALGELRGERRRAELEYRRGAQQYCLEINLHLIEGADPALAVVTLRDIGSQREAEYMLDSYSRLADRHARDLEREKTRAEKLLLNMMPRSVYEELREYGTTTPQRFENASVIMLDLVGFSEMTMTREPSGLVSELNDIFSAFDRVVELFDCERIKTIGDAYLAVSGVPETNPDHVANAAKVALRMRRYLERRNATGPQEWQCRIGLATGPLIGSVVGIHRYVYDVFGPAVNLAARLEAICQPGEILICNNAMQHLTNQFNIGPMRSVDIKGFGPCPVAALLGEQKSR